MSDSAFQRIHIFGAPGSGVTTLGKALAAHLGYAHFDTDDYHWFTEDALPYKRRRNPEHRRQLLTRDLDAADRWVLSGSLCGWGDVFVPRFDKVVYLWLPAPMRTARIEARETLRYGAERIAPGGDLHVVYEKFQAWAAAYDHASDNIRSRNKELEWFAALPCITQQIEIDYPVKELIEMVIKL
ncbi:MAG: hypothetical protein JNM22_19165 [Saprospiraceae bacterium]|nr:hypothetical protein [Saprospiraceae bacterium]